MNLSKISCNTIVGKALRWPLRLIPPATVVPILQGRLRGKRWVVGSSSHGCWLGSYEYDKQHRFAELIPVGGVVYDVGAHVGFYTLLAAELVGPNGHVIAFEPFPANVRHLRRHVELNRLSNVTIIEAAVTAAEGEARFQPGPIREMGRVAIDGVLEVRAITLDALAQRGYIPAPDVIKMDIEGGEWDALNGAIATVSTQKPLIFLATHGDEIRVRCHDLLSELGYQQECIGNSVNEVVAVHSDRRQARQ